MIAPTTRPAAQPSRSSEGTPFCHYCGEPLEHTFVDLGMTPLSNSYPAESELVRSETFYPLHAYVCERCLLVQLEEHESPERIFGEYAYFSSYSDTWLAHCRTFADAVTKRFDLGDGSRVVEVGSNDGCLLECFMGRGVEVLGIDPAANVARVAIERGVPTRVGFFGADLARELAASDGPADLVVGNNVLAHAPRINDFVAGLRALLAPQGVITLEFPHLLNLVEKNQFDTIYHEHFFYFSLLVVRRVLAEHGLTVFDVDELSTHGGSLRVYAQQADTGLATVDPAVEAMVAKERRQGLDRLETYETFASRVERLKRRLLGFLIRARDEGRSIAGYGAAAKGNTLLNYCGIRTDFIDYVVDRSPYKQGRYLPGSRIPIVGPERIFETRPDYVLILPWNLEEEIVGQMSAIREWGGRFIVPIPDVRVVE